MMDDGALSGACCGGPNMSVMSTSSPTAIGIIRVNVIAAHVAAVAVRVWKWICAESDADVGETFLSDAAKILPPPAAYSANRKKLGYVAGIAPACSRMGHWPV